MMNYRKVKRKCGVKGCKNVDCVAITRIPEYGNTVIICRRCLAEALEATKEKTVTAIPDVVPEEAEENAEEIPEEIPEETAEQEYICPKCGKKYTAKRFYDKHIEACEG